MSTWLRQSSRIQKHLDHWIVYDDKGDPVGAYQERSEADALKHEIDRTNWVKRSRDWIWDVRKRREHEKKAARDEENPKDIELEYIDPDKTGLGAPDVNPAAYNYEGDLTPQQTLSPSKDVVEKYDMPDKDYSNTDGYGYPFKPSQLPWRMFDRSLGNTTDMPGEWNMTASLKVKATEEAYIAIAQEALKSLIEDYKKNKEKPDIVEEGKAVDLKLPLDKLFSDANLEKAVSKVQDLSETGLDQAVSILKSDLSKFLEESGEEQIPFEQEISKEKFPSEVKERTEVGLDKSVEDASNDFASRYGSTISGRGYPLFWHEFKDELDSLQKKYALNEKQKFDLLNSLINTGMVWGLDAPGIEAPQDTTGRQNYDIKLKLQYLNAVLHDLRFRSRSIKSLKDLYKILIDEGIYGFYNKAKSERFFESAMPSLEKLRSQDEVEAYGIDAGIIKYYDDLLKNTYNRASHLQAALEAFYPREESKKVFDDKALVRLLDRVDAFITSWVEEVLPDIQNYYAKINVKPPEPSWDLIGEVLSRTPTVRTAAVMPEDYYEEEPETVQERHEPEEKEVTVEESKLEKAISEVHEELIQKFEYNLKRENPEKSDEELREIAEDEFSSEYTPEQIQDLAESRIKSPEEALPEEQLELELEEKETPAPPSEWTVLMSGIKAENPGWTEEQVKAQADKEFLETIQERIDLISPRYNELNNKLEALKSKEGYALFYNFEDPGLIRWVSIPGGLDKLNKNITDQQHDIAALDLPFKEEKSAIAEREKLTEKYNALGKKEEAEVNKLKEVHQNLLNKLGESEGKRPIKETEKLKSDIEKARKEVERAVDDYIHRETPEQKSLSTKIKSFEDKIKGYEEERADAKKDLSKYLERDKSKLTKEMDDKLEAFRKEVTPLQKQWDDEIATVLDPYARMTYKEKLKFIPTPESQKIEKGLTPPVWQKRLRREESSARITPSSAFTIPEFDEFVKMAPSQGLNEVYSNWIEGVLAQYPGWNEKIVDKMKLYLQITFNTFDSAGINIVDRDKLEKKLKAAEKL